MYIDFVWLLQLIAWASDVSEEIGNLLEQLALEDEPSYADLTLEEKTAILKQCTKIVANLGLNLACMPMGYTTTLLFDTDGNPIP